MKKYIKKYITRDWLYSNNFRYNRTYSTDKEAVYSQRFIVSRYLGIPVLECEILVHYPEGIVQINVYKAGTREKYPAFYDRDYGVNTLINNDELYNEFYEYPYPAQDGNLCYNGEYLFPSLPQKAPSVLGRFVQRSVCLQRLCYALLSEYGMAGRNVLLPVTAYFL